MALPTALALTLLVFSFWSLIELFELGAIFCLFYSILAYTYLIFIYQEKTWCAYITKGKQFSYRQSVHVKPTLHPNVLPTTYPCKWGKCTMRCNSYKCCEISKFLSTSKVDFTLWGNWVKSVHPSQFSTFVIHAT